MLGDEIEVESRSAYEKVGLRFVAALGAHSIELKKATDLPIGTAIKVRISKRTYDLLAENAATRNSWDWYCGTSPRVIRIIGGKELTQGFSEPADNNLPPEWRRLTNAAYEDIKWTYSRQAPKLTCNFIRVHNISGRYDDNELPLLYSNSELDLATPAVAVLDPDGNLPLTLQRTGLASYHFPFAEKLLDEVIKDMFAYMIALSDIGTMDQKTVLKSPEYWGIDNTYDPLPGGWAASASGWTLRLPKFLRRIGESVAILPPTLMGDQYTKRFAVLLRCRSTCDTDYSGSDFGNLVNYIEKLRPSGARIYVPALDWGTPDGWRDSRSRDGSVFEVGECNFESSEISHELEVEDRQMELAAEVFLSDHQDDPACRISTLWDEIIRGPIIPFDARTRRKSLKHAYKVLGPYISAHKEVLQQRGKKS